MKISVLHATYRRPAKAVDAMKLALMRALHRPDIEYIFSVNKDDDTVDSLRALVDYAAAAMLGVNIVIHQTAVTSSAPAWNEAAKIATGDILVQGQDDVEPPEAWDEKLVMLFAQAKGPAFLAVRDGFRTDKLCCTAIMNRAYYEQEGYFLFPGYESVFSDDDVTLRAYRNHHDAKAELIEARDIVFFHRHHYHDKTVPDDATYQKENRPEAYAKGERLFEARNPGWRDSAFVDWRK
jgi:hypothetical protein